jgi:hypothetical protein
MDKLLEYRKVNVSEIAATKSADALIAYINQSEYGRWVICHYAHLSPTDRLVFIKGMNEVLPYVANRETFISHIKFYMKENLCRQLDFDCWVNDFMAMSKDNCILTDEGYEVIKNKYSAEIDIFINEMSLQHEQDVIEEEKIYQEYINLNKGIDSSIVLSDNEELPFKEYRDEYI